MIPARRERRSRSSRFSASISALWVDGRQAPRLQTRRSRSVCTTGNTRVKRADASQPPLPALRARDARQDGSCGPRGPWWEFAGVHVGAKLRTRRRGDTTSASQPAAKSQRRSRRTSAVIFVSQGPRQDDMAVAEGFEPYHPAASNATTKHDNEAHSGYRHRNDASWKCVMLLKLNCRIGCTRGLLMDRPCHPRWLA